MVAATSHDSEVRLYDAATGRPAGTLAGHTKDVRGVAYSPDGNLIATGEVDKTILLWDAATRKARPRAGGPHGGGELREVLARRHSGVPRLRKWGNDDAASEISSVLAVRRNRRAWPRRASGRSERLPARKPADQFEVHFEDMDERLAPGKARQRLERRLAQDGLNDPANLDLVDALLRRPRRRHPV